MTHNPAMRPSVLEICAGAGGQALGLENAGFSCAATVEIDHYACESLRLNRPEWTVIEGDIHDRKKFRPGDFRGVDLLAGGVPCPPFSIAGKQLGHEDERDLFPAALALVEEIKPRAVMLENVPGFGSQKFQHYRDNLAKQFSRLGYTVMAQTLNASDFGVPQLRPRYIMVALQAKYQVSFFEWPQRFGPTPTVSDTIGDLMGRRGWPGLKEWRERARGVAPTIVGGSKKHGGPDLGPTRARRAWRELGVDGLAIAADAPGAEDPVEITPRLTMRMVARVQGFPDDWQFVGGKTAAYRQVGNALPPPVAEAVGRSIGRSLGFTSPRRRKRG